jgi:TonB-linked SusC/RagA family outer membrane protein
MRKVLLTLSLLIISVVAVLAQQTVRGTVTSADDGSSIPGVNVVLKGTTTGTVTDIDGNYSISVPSQGGVLVFSFIGFATQEIQVGSQTTIDVVLTAEVTQLSEIVVTGYGEVLKSAYTGSAVTVNKEKIENLPMTSVDQVLQGSVPGLQLSNTSGTPGSDQNIRIRGISSITANNEPLFVIDGIPVVSGDNSRNSSAGNLSVLSSLNPNDVESVSVLKDAAATAVYGARGANGVIVITTKSGKAGQKPRFTFSAQAGSVDKAVEGPKMLNSQQWDELYYEALINAGYYPDRASAEDPNTGFPNNWDGVTNTDWRKAVARDNAKTQAYDLSVSGGNDQTIYFMSFGLFDQDGINLGSDYERISGKLNLTQKVNEVFSFTTSTTGSYVEQNGQLEGSAYFGNPDAAYLFTWPIDPPRNPDGTPNLDLGTSTFNPIYSADNHINLREQSRVLNSTSLDFDILDNLRFSSKIGMDYLVTEELSYRDPYYGDGAAINGWSYAYYNRNWNWQWRNMIDYSLILNDEHKIDFKLVHEAQRNEFYTIATGGIGIASGGLYYPSSVATPDYASGYLNDWMINSILGMVNYTFKGNIFVDGTLRREGNSRFSSGNRWGTFYSLGASWVFSDEAFMQNMNWLNTSKIRVSYGKTGNAGVGLNQYQSTLSYSGTYNGTAGSFPQNPGNDLLTWETNNSINVGLDFGVFDRVNGSVEYFSRESSDLLLDVPLSYTSGFSSQTQNVGKMVNKGIEVQLNGDIIRTSNVLWNLGFNLTSLDNEVTELPTSSDGEEIGITTSTQTVTVGQPVYGWDLKTWAGVNPDTGEPLWYVDGQSGETTSVYADAGRSYQGTSAAPTLYGSIFTRVEFFGVYISGSMYHSSGNSVYDSWAYYTQSDGRFTYNVANGYARQYDRWQNPGDDAPNPQNIWGNTTSSNSNSSRRLYGGDYWRLRDVTIGYNLPQDLISSLGVGNINIYIRGTNLWTKVKDPLMEFDPEVPASGFISLQAPPLKTLVGGLKIDF